MKKYFFLCGLVSSCFSILVAGGNVKVNDFLDAIEAGHQRERVIQDLAAATSSVLTHARYASVAIEISKSYEAVHWKYYPFTNTDIKFTTLLGQAICDAMVTIINRNPLKRIFAENLSDASAEEMQSHFITMALHAKKIGFEDAFSDQVLQTIADGARENDALLLSTYFKTHVLCMEFFQQAPLYASELRKYYKTFTPRVAKDNLVEALCGISIMVHQNPSLVKKMSPVQNRANRLYDILEQKKLDQLPARDSDEMRIMWQGGNIDVVRQYFCKDLDKYDSK